MAILSIHIHAVRFVIVDCHCLISLPRRSTSRQNLSIRSLLSIDDSLKELNITAEMVSREGSMRKLRWPCLGLVLLTSGVFEDLIVHCNHGWKFSSRKFKPASG